MASNIENDFRLALLALKKNTLNAFEKAFIKSIRTYSKKELTSMSGKQKKFLSDIAFKGVEKPRESKMNIEQRISILEKKILKESSDEIQVGDKVKYVGDNGKDVYLNGHHIPMYKVPLTIGKTYKVKDLYGSNVVVIDDNGDIVNGHGINSSRFVLEATRVRESRDETITDFLRKNHVSQRFIDAIESGYEGIFFDAPLGEFVLGNREDSYGKEILTKTIMVISDDYPSWNNHLKGSKKDIIAFLTSMTILFRYYQSFLSTKMKKIVKFQLHFYENLSSDLISDYTSDFGVRWDEFDSNDRLIGKQKIFSTVRERDNFVQRLKLKNNFNSILSLSN